MYRQGTLYADSQCKLGVQETGRDWTAVAKVNLTPGRREGGRRRMKLIIIVGFLFIRSLLVGVSVPRAPKAI